MRSPTSHKGENGSVAVIGGSQFQHGAPIFSALAAEAAGVDLIFLFIPAIHAAVARAFSLNMQVHPFGSDTSDEISSQDRARMVELLATMDAAVIGPGLSRSQSSLASMMTLLQACPCPLIADASALQRKTLEFLLGKHAVVTPHRGEFERMDLLPNEVPLAAKKFACTFLLKGPEDTIVSEDGETQSIVGGNAGLTVGGTGDALAGLAAGLIAQRHPHSEACRIASTVIKRAGDVLFSRKGYAYTTSDVIGCIPTILKDLV